VKLLLPLLLLAATAPSADTPVPVDQDPEHRIVLQNEYVQVFRVTLPPGKSTGMHVHAHDDAAVRLGDATIRIDLPGGAPSTTEEARVGGVSARTNEPRPCTHRVNNVGKTTFDVVDVQILRRPDGPASPAILPPAAENAQLRVYRHELAPGATAPMHTHTRPYVIVAATPMQLRMASPDGRVMVHPIGAGDTHWVNTPVTHTLGNDGTEKGVIVEIELK
jgi:quercetin dioxygenase-like cupin family protein